MKVSVIIPTFNRAETLERAISSVLTQTYSDFDLWVIDDGSTDQTENLMHKWSSDSRVNYRKRGNRGVSAARNWGISLSASEWVAFLDSDDEWLPTKLDKQISFSQEHSQIPLIHGEEIWIRRGRRVNPKKIHHKSGGKILIPSLKRCLISPSATLIKRTLLDEMEGFDENFPVCEDYDLWLKITSRYQVGFITEPILIKYGGHADQLSARYFAMDYWRVRSMNCLLDSPHLSQEERREVYKVMVRKGEILLQGYHKHQNLQHLAFISSIIENCRCNLE